MAIPTVSSVSSQRSLNNITDDNCAHTVAPGLVDSVMLVLVQSPQFSAANSAAWNGTPMTNMSVGSNNFWCTAFYLRNPEPGSFDASVHWNVISREADIVVLTIEGAGDPVYLGEDSATSSGASFNAVPTAVDALLLDFIMSQITTHTQGSGQTEQVNIDTNVGNYRMSVSTKDAPNAELVVNGGFDGSADDWFIGDIGEYDNNHFLIPDGSEGSGIEAGLVQDIPSVIAGNSYTFSMDLTGDSGSLIVGLGGADDAQTVAVTPGTTTLTLVAQAEDTSLFILVDGSFVGDVTIDNISLKEVVPITVAFGGAGKTYGMKVLQLSPVVIPPPSVSLGDMFLVF